MGPGCRSRVGSLPAQRRVGGVDHRWRSARRRPAGAVVPVPAACAGYRPGGRTPVASPSSKRRLRRSAAPLEAGGMRPAAVPSASPSAPVAAAAPRARSRPAPAPSPRPASARSCASSESCRRAAAASAGSSAPSGRRGVVRVPGRDRPPPAPAPPRRSTARSTAARQAARSRRPRSADPRRKRSARLPAADRARPTDASAWSAAPVSSTSRRSPAVGEGEAALVGLLVEHELSAAPHRRRLRRAPGAAQGQHAERGPVHVAVERPVGALMAQQVGDQVAPAEAPRREAGAPQREDRALELSRVAHALQPASA